MECESERYIIEEGDDGASASNEMTSQCIQRASKIL